MEVDSDKVSDEDKVSENLQKLVADLRTEEGKVEDVQLDKGSRECRSNKRSRSREMKKWNNRRGRENKRSRSRERERTLGRERWLRSRS